MPENDGTIMMEGVKLIYRNFTGRETQFNREGDRNFAVLIDDQLAETLTNDGWNIKWLKPRDESEEENPQAFLPVALGYKGRPPRIALVTGRGRTFLDEGQVEMLDWATIINVDLIVRPYEWNVGGKGGIKAYLQSMYVTIEEDPLEIKYGGLDQA